MKRLMCVLMVMMVLCGMLFSQGDKEVQAPSATGTKAAAPVKVGMIASVFGTQSFNDDVKDGVVAVSSKYGIQNVCMEVPEVTDTANSIRTLISQGCNFIVISSSDYEDGMKEVASEYPNVKFLYLADKVTGDANIISTEYAENEAAFLLGVLAGRLTKANNVGGVLAIKGDTVQEKYRYGFTAGVQAVNPSCQVQMAYTNSYADINKGNEVATAMYTKGADFVGTFAGACNLGVFNAAKAAGEGKYCFGAAKGQFDKMPDKIVASLVKPVDKAILSIIGDYIEHGTFDSSKTLKLGLSNQGVMVRYTNQNAELLKLVTPEMKKELDSYSEKIINGSLKVPANEQEFKAMGK